MLKYLKKFKKSISKKLKREVKEISYQEIKKDNYIIIDVRSRKEYKEGHINGAINMPLSEIKLTIQQIDKSKKILLYWQSGLRSKKAFKILEDLGYDNIYNLKGGLENI